MTTTIKLQVHKVIGKLIDRMGEHRLAMTHASQLTTTKEGKAVNIPISNLGDYWYNYMSRVYPWNQLKGVLTLPLELWEEHLTLDVDVVGELFKGVGSGNDKIE